MSPEYNTADVIERLDLTNEILKEISYKLPNQIQANDLYASVNYGKYMRFLEVVAYLSEASNVPMEFKTEFANWIEKARIETLSK